MRKVGGWRQVRDAVPGSHNNIPLPFDRNLEYAKIQQNRLACGRLGPATANETAG